MRDENMGCGLLGVSTLFGLTCLAGWITHIVVCLQDERYILLVAGALAAPIGVIHGIGHWFGAW